MNERIERMLKQATVVTEGWSDENGTTRYYSVDHNKFAELIVRECMRMCDVAAIGYESHHHTKQAYGCYSAKEYIAEHFEVEE